MVEFRPDDRGEELAQALEVAAQFPARYTPDISARFPLRGDVVETVPFNPFVFDDEGMDSERIVELPFMDVAHTADGLERVAEHMDWSPIELQAIRDAAAMVRWSARETGLSENEVIRNRINRHGGLTLMLREAAEDKGK